MAHKEPTPGEEQFLLTSSPSVEMWDKVYATQNDKWSVPILSDVVKGEIFEKLTNGEQGLDFFLPLCGRSPDMVWLTSQGHRVTGVEWVEGAVVQFFTENKLDYEVERDVNVGKVTATMYTAKNVPITVYCCDFFSMSSDTLGQFDCIWDNGSVGSFHESQRPDYVCIMRMLLKSKGKMLLANFNYKLAGPLKPPYPLTREEVKEMYSTDFNVVLAQSEGIDEFIRCYGDHERREFPIHKMTNFLWDFHLITPKS